MGAFCRQILTKEARDYIDVVGAALRIWARSNKFKPMADYAKVEVWFILPRTSCDASNYGKVLFDAMEAGGIVTDDRYILPCVSGVWHDTKTPQAIVKLVSQGDLADLEGEG